MSGASAPIRTAEEAAAWLEGLINHERRPGFRYERLGLDAIVGLLGRLGHPERDLSIVHVAGSKGKGSTCLLVESVLGAAGERVGTFTSPHLERWTERFRIDGAEVAEADLAAAVETVRPHVEALRAEDPAHAPTFFDATTATALVLFSRLRVERAVLEVGLGGRLDSTNAVTPAVTCVTQIELEHTDKLGKTLAAIAAEKAGILEPGVPCVIGDLAPEAERVVRARAEAVGAPVHRLGVDFRVERDPAPAPGAATGVVQRFAYAERGFEVKDLRLPVLGPHQVDNAGLALAIVRRLAAHPPDGLARAARQAFANVALPGRLEVVSERPIVIVDAAHTGASARSLAAVLAALIAERRHLVLSISRDKDPSAILDALVPVGDELWVTRADPIRSCDPASLADLAARRAPAVEIHCIEDPRDAVRTAFAALGPEDLLCCTGSVYLAGAARGALRTGAARAQAPSRD